MHLKTDNNIERLFRIQLTLPDKTQERTLCDAKDMIPYIPQKTKNFLDLGCGSGRVSIMLNKLLKKKNFFLADCEDSQLAKHWKQYSDDGILRFYNKMKLTEHFCSLNGMTNYSYIIINKNLVWSKYPKDIDILYSKYAVGWHFPINTYKDVYPKILKDGALCFFTWQYRKKSPKEYNKKMLPKYFKVVDIYKDSFPYQPNKTLVLRYHNEK